MSTRIPRRPHSSEIKVTVTIELQGVKATQIRNPSGVHLLAYKDWRKSVQETSALLTFSALEDCIFQLETAERPQAPLALPTKHQSAGYNKLLKKIRESSLQKNPVSQ